MSHFTTTLVRFLTRLLVLPLHSLGSSLRSLVSSLHSLVSSLPSLVSSLPSLVSSLPSLVSSLRSLVSSLPSLVSSLRSLVSSLPPLVSSLRSLLSSIACSNATSLGFTLHARFLVSSFPCTSLYTYIRHLRIYFWAGSRPRGAVGTWGHNGELEGPRGFKLGPRTFPCFPHQFRDILKKSIF